MFISKVFKLQFGFACRWGSRENIRSLIGKDLAGGKSFLIHISLTKSQIATEEDSIVADCLQNFFQMLKVVFC